MITVHCLPDEKKEFLAARKVANRNCKYLQLLIVDTRCVLARAVPHVHAGGQCARVNYHASCPEGWASTGSECVAPLDYKVEMEVLARLL